MNTRGVVGRSLCFFYFNVGLIRVLGSIHAHPRTTWQVNWAEHPAVELLWVERCKNMSGFSGVNIDSTYLALAKCKRGVGIINEYLARNATYHIYL